jgi:hypothetical protein
MRAALRIAVLAGLLLPVHVHAQRNASTATPATSVATGAPASVTPAAALEQMRASLRELAAAQEAYFADHGTYTTDLVALKLFPRKVRTGAMAQVIFAGGRGWSAMATHPELRHRSCVVYVGNRSELPSIPTTLADLMPAVVEGDPACDPI